MNWSDSANADENSQPMWTTPPYIGTLSSQRACVQHEWIWINLWPVKIIRYIHNAAIGIPMIVGKRNHHCEFLDDLRCFLLDTIDHQGTRNDDTNECSHKGSILHRPRSLKIKVWNISKKKHICKVYIPAASSCLEAIRIKSKRLKAA